MLTWSPSWQVFYPKDSINNPLVLDLIFRQVRHRPGPEAPAGVPWELGYPPTGVLVYASRRGHPTLPCRAAVEEQGVPPPRGVTLLPPHSPATSHPLPQIFNDTLSDTCIRISQEERLRLKSLFGNLHPPPASRRSWVWGARTWGAQTWASHTQPILISWASPSHNQLCLKPG